MSIHTAFIEHFSRLYESDRRFNVGETNASSSFTKIDGDKYHELQCSSGDIIRFQSHEVHAEEERGRFNVRYLFYFIVNNRFRYLLVCGKLINLCVCV